MTFELVLTADTKQSIFNIIETEKRTMDRSTLDISKKNGKTIFKVRAKDLTALKSSVNHILKILAIHEKTENLIKDG